MKIRRALLKDVGRLYELMSKTKEVHLTKNVYSKEFIKKLIESRTTYFIVAEENNKIIGLLTAAIWKRLGASYWDMFIVDKESRNKGIGRKIYNNYLNYLKKNKISYTWLITKSNNRKIENTLKKFKFKKRDLCRYYDLEL